MSRRSWIVIVLVLAVVAAALVGVLLATAGGGATVPDVTGMTQEEAVTALEASGFAVGDVTEAADDAVPAGSVVSQDPEGGTTADEGAAVALTVSAGPGTVEVPNVMGLDVAEAEGILADAGFTTETAYEYDLRAPADQVMGQLPAPGEQAAPGSSIGLLVSQGLPTETTVPEVTGLSEAQATRKLAEAGLRAVAAEAYNDTVAEGVVASQEPAAGEVVSPLSDVLIEVSLGEGTATVTVPDLVGLTRSDAVDELEALGLSAEIAEAYSPDAGRNVVMGQEPRAGTDVEPASSVGLLVSLGPSPSPSPSKTPSASPTPTPTPTKTATTTPSATPSPKPTVWPPEIEPPPDAGGDYVKVPDFTGMTVEAAEKELEELGLESYVVRQPSDEYAEGLVVDQLPEAGRRIPQTYAVFLLVSSGPLAGAVTLPAED